MLKRLAVLLFISSTLTFTASTTIGCSGSTGGGTGGGSGGSGGGAADPDLVCDASPPATTFAKVYSDVFTPSCLGTCHKTSSTDGSKDYGNYETETKAFEVVNKVSLYAGAEKTLKVVEPNKLDNSSLFMKCLAKAKTPGGKNLGGAMPLSAAALTAAQKQTLKDWICSGAKM